MFGRGSGWGIPTAAHTLDITLGGIGEKPIVISGHLETREYLNMTISMDHDIIDGAPATRFALELIPDQRAHNRFRSGISSKAK